MKTSPNPSKTPEKWAVVTGAANGIGAAVARQLAGTGEFCVLVVDLDMDGLSRLQSDSDPACARALHLCAVDLADPGAVTRDLLPKIKDMKQIHVFVSSHGIAHENLIGQHDIWDRVMAVNLTATQRLLSEVEPMMAGNGRIVVVSSILGRVGKLANTAYCASKHALLGLVKGLALDLAPRRITVNAVLPCWVDTPMLRREIEPQAQALGISIDQMLRRIRKKIPLRRMISGSDVADCVLFLVSPSASMITAQGIVIDGGFGCGVS